MAYANNPFHDYLKRNGRNSYMEDEYNKYVRENLAEYIKVIIPEVEKISNTILEKYNPSSHFFIDIGSGPSPIAAYLQNKKGVSRANLPLSGFRDAVGEHGFYVMNPLRGQQSLIPESEYLRILREHFDRFIPREALNSGKTIVLIDTVQRGTTLINAHRRISEYVHSINPHQRVLALGLLHPGVRSITSRDILDHESKDQIKERLKSFEFISLDGTSIGNFFFNRTFQEFSEHSRFEPGRENSSDIKRSDLFLKMSEEIRKYVSTSKSCELLF